MKKSTLLEFVSSFWIVYVYIFLIYTISVIATLIGGAGMELESIGKNIRKFRLMKKLRQEDLAEKQGSAQTMLVLWSVMKRYLPSKLLLIL